MDKAEVFDLTGSKFLGWRGFQSLVFENIPQPTLSGTEQRWPTKVRIRSSNVLRLFEIVMCSKYFFFASLPLETIA